MAVLESLDGDLMAVLKESHMPPVEPMRPEHLEALEGIERLARLVERFGVKRVETWLKNLAEIMGERRSAS